jgi:biopolymer transport protein ExbD
MPLKIARDEIPQLNLTPMIDVVFNLIVFFMVGTRFNQIEHKLQLRVPQVSHAGALTPASEKRAVNVYQDGTVTLEGESVTLEVLTKRLAAARTQYKDVGVIVRGDAGSSFQRVAEVLSACKRAGIADLGVSVRIAARER